MFFHTLYVNAKTAVAVPGWAFRFYVSHFLWIAGLSAIPSVHRFVLLFFTPDWPPTIAAVLEIGVGAVRLLLLWLIIRASIIRDPQLRDIGKDGRKRRIKYFMKHRWLSLVFQLILIGAATLIFDVFLEGVVGSWVPDNFETKYLGILLAIKNPTIIAWVLIWMVGIPRQMMLCSLEETRGKRAVT